MWLKFVTLRFLTVLRSYNAQEYQPITVCILYDSVPKKTGASSWLLRIEVEAMKYGSARLIGNAK